MTRYARAKGSKASNERLPNEATPWSLMKQQLEEQKDKQPTEIKKSAQELLKDHKERDASDTIGNVNHDWAEFDSNKFKSNMRNKSKSNVNKIKNSKPKKNCTNLAENSENNNTHSNTSKKNNCTESQDMKDTKIEKMDDETNKFSNKKEKRKLNDSTSEGKELSASQNDDDPKYIKPSKRQKRNQKRKLAREAHNEPKSFKRDTSNKSSCNETKEKKIKENGEYKRRKPDVRVTKIMIDGVEIEIVKYDGFPVRKEDAERLAELKQKLIMKGVPKSNVDLAMKLERRKAEKALARFKKQVCFNCRLGGHKLSDCPELDKEQTGTGICFKCGSTEHTHFECKVNKDPTYRYAKCFICREQGHISVQCPDNPKGIYPNGGCCKICGAVTHLKKDCPDLVNAKEENAVTAEKMDNSAVESLQKDVKRDDESSERPRKKNIIKFL